jgi:hypothetical protein
MKTVTMDFTFYYHLSVAQCLGLSIIALITTYASIPSKLFAEPGKS